MSCEICGKQFNILDIHRRFCDECVDTKKTETEAEDRCPKCGLVGATMKHVVHCDGIVPLTAPKTDNSSTESTTQCAICRAQTAKWWKIVRPPTGWVCKGCYDNAFNAKPDNATNTQPDNAHYTGGIEPWEYIRANKLDFFEGNVVEYVTWWRKKGGVEDLRKAKVYIEELIRQQETTEPPS